VFTGATGAPEVFGAYSADDGGGSQVISIVYDAGAGEFQFTANGASGNLGGILANKWYSIEFAYEAGTSFSADVAGANGFSGSPTISGTPAATNIESARLGWISGGTSGNINTDEFESTRGVAIGRLCKSDANGDNVINVADASTVVAERLGQSVASGQPDANEDGQINVADA